MIIALKDLIVLRIIFESLIDMSTFNTEFILCKKYMLNIKKLTCLKWTYGLFGKNYRVATLFTFCLTEFEIIGQLILMHPKS